MLTDLHERSHLPARCSTSLCYLRICVYDGTTQRERAAEVVFIQKLYVESNFRLLLGEENIAEATLRFRDICVLSCMYVCACLCRCVLADRYSHMFVGDRTWSDVENQKLYVCIYIYIHINSICYSEPSTCAWTLFI